MLIAKAVAIILTVGLTKSDVQNAIGMDISDFVKTFNLTSIKPDIDKSDSDK